MLGAHAAFSVVKFYGTPIIPKIQTWTSADRQAAIKIGALCLGGFAQNLLAAGYLQFVSRIAIVRFAWISARRMLTPSLPARSPLPTQTGVRHPDPEHRPLPGRAPRDRHAACRLCRHRSCCLGRRQRVDRQHGRRLSSTCHCAQRAINERPVRAPHLSLLLLTSPAFRRAARRFTLAPPRHGQQRQPPRGAAVRGQHLGGRAGGGVRGAGGDSAARPGAAGPPPGQAGQPAVRTSGVLQHWEPAAAGTGAHHLLPVRALCAALPALVPCCGRATRPGAPTPRAPPP